MDEGAAAVKWYLTQKAIGEPEIDVREEDEDPALGYSMLRELARGGRSGLYEIQPGMWIGSTLPDADQGA